MCVSIAAAANKREGGPHCSALSFNFFRVCVSGQGRFLFVRFWRLASVCLVGRQQVVYTLQQEGQLMPCFSVWMMSCVLWASCAALL